MLKKTIQSPQYRHSMFIKGGLPNGIHYSYIFPN